MDFESIVTETRDDAWRKLMRNPWEPLHLYYGPSTEATYGRVTARPEGELVAPDLVLACSERVPASLTRDQLRAWVRERCLSLPLLPFGEGKL